MPHFKILFKSNILFRSKSFVEMCFDKLFYNWSDLFLSKEPIHKASVTLDWLLGTAWSVSGVIIAALDLLQAIANVTLAPGCVFSAGLELRLLAL